ncbi:hypothetical protein AUC31_11300 [Planococcus rifietoensis]|uniref:Uncharacterized protein n=1 Tax=Planococcus rifietoensis TaxID=200991 RepID=A0A0U2J7E0_9BACL|nr:hypothetical protein [Planococcus rifietoensis]ALS75746.1 hypothetical protein AUC31_11300 [Planococcus rifietoensis]
MEWNLNKTSINLPYSCENLKTLLDTICKKENKFPQVDFCMWCDNVTMAWDEEDLDDQDQLAFVIARDIEAQWDLYWYEFYSHEQLMKMDLTKLELPPDWFKEWVAELVGK